LAAAAAEAGSVFAGVGSAASTPASVLGVPGVLAWLAVLSMVLVA